MECRFTHVAFEGIAAVVPSDFIVIDDELRFFQDDPKKLARAKKIIGFGKRHVVGSGVTAVDLCEEAARILMRDMGVDPASVDALVLVNQSPDHVHPSGSCILHGRLGLPKGCATLDIGLGCSGYVYGLWLAHSLIASGAARRVLLLAGDTPSLHSDPRNRLTSPLFGDAGTATLLGRTEAENPAWFVLGSDGTGWNHIAIPGGGFRLPVDEAMLRTVYTDAAGNPWRMNESLLNGMAVFDFTLHEVPPSILRVMECAGVTREQVDFFALHQANKQIVQAVGAALGLDEENVYWQTFTRYGNQSTASVACTLCDALAYEMPQRDMRLLLSGFGVGLSWANAVLACSRAYNSGVRLFAPSPARTGMPDRQGREEQIAFWKHQFCGDKE